MRLINAAGPGLNPAHQVPVEAGEWATPLWTEQPYHSHNSMSTAVYRLAARITHTDTTLLFVGDYTSDEIESAPEFSFADGS